MGPSTMRAITTGRRALPYLLFNAVKNRNLSHGVAVRDDVPVPKLEDNEMLVRVQYVALNPSTSPPPSRHVALTR